MDRMFGIKKRVRAWGRVVGLGAILAVAAGATDLVEVGEPRLVAGGGSGEGAGALNVSFLPQDIVVGPEGVYVADEQYNVIRRIGDSGVVHTVAGNGLYGFNGDGLPALESAWGVPAGLALGPGGDLYGVDLANRQVRRVGADGRLRTVLHAGQALFAALPGRFAPARIAFDAEGRLYVADRGNNVVWQIDPDGGGRRVAGNGQRGFSGDGAPSALGQIADPRAVVVGADGVVYVADLGNRRVRRVGTDGILSTVAGNGEEDDWDGEIDALEGSLKPVDLSVDQAGRLLILDGLGARLLRLEAGRLQVVFVFPAGADPNAVEVAPDGRILLSDYAARRVFVLSIAGEIQAIAGNGGVRASGDGGPAAEASFFQPLFLAHDDAGALYVSDGGNGVVRRIGVDGSIERVAGGGDGQENSALDATLGRPAGLAFDGAGRLYMADEKTHRILRLEENGQLSPVVGPVVGHGADLGRSAPALEIGLKAPTGLAFDGAGRLYIADSGNKIIRRVDQEGQVETVLGGGSDPAAEGSLPLAIGLELPWAVDVDRYGSLLLSDAAAHRVLRLGRDGLVQVVAGTGSAGRGAVGRQGRDTALDTPLGVRADGAGGVYVADSGNGRLLHIGSDGVVRVLGPEADYQVLRERAPGGMALDRAGNLVYSDLRDHRLYHLELQRRLADVGQRVQAPGALGVEVMAVSSRPDLLDLIYQPTRDRLLLSHGEGLEIFTEDWQRRLHAEFLARSYSVAPTAAGLLLATPSVLDRTRPLTLVPEDKIGRTFQIPYELFFSGVEAVAAAAAGDIYLHQRQGQVLRFLPASVALAPYFELPPGDAVIEAGSGGILYVARVQAGVVLAATDLNGDGVVAGAAERRQLAAFETPIVDLAWDGESLYVALGDGSIRRLDAQGRWTLYAAGFAPSIVAISPGPGGHLYVLEAGAAGGRIIRLLGPQTRLAVWPESVDWGRAAVGQMLKRTLVLRNIGTEPLELEAHDRLGLLADRRLLLAAGERRLVEISTVPTGYGAVSDTLVWRRSNGFEVASTTVAFVGLAPELVPGRQLVDFGPVEVGRQGGTTLWVRNGGNDPLHLESVTAEGAFSYKGAQETVVPAGDSLGLALVYAPDKVGALRGELLLRSSDPLAPLRRIQVRGLGATARAPILPSRIDLGRVAVSQRQERVVQVHNTGLVQLRLDDIGGGDPQVQVKPRSLHLSPGQSADLRLRFAPRRHGGIAGTVLMRSNDPLHPLVQMQWRGEGVSTQVEFAPDSLHLAPVALGQERRGEIVLRNLSKRTIEVGGAVLNNRQFRLVERPTRIAAGASGVFLVEYRPLVGGETTARLEVYTDLAEAPRLQAVFVGRALGVARLSLAAAVDTALWPGDEIEVGLRVTGANRLRGVVLPLNLPPGVVFSEVVFTDTSLFSGGLAVRQAETGGRLVLGLSPTGGAALQGVSGDGEVARLRFKVRNQNLGGGGAVAGTAFLRYIDAYEDTVALDAVPWSLGFAADFDGSGQLDLEDFFLLGEYLAAGGALTETRFDLDGDGTVDDLDLQYLVSFLDSVNLNSAKTANNGMTPVLAPPWPNPFNSTAVLRYHLPQAVSGELAVYNALGQKVRVLARGILAAGWQQSSWDGLDDNRQALGTGVYFAVLKGEGILLRHRLMLLR
jgi:sugar lactone lactonase YvrE